MSRDPMADALAQLNGHGLPHRPDLTRYDTWVSVCPVCRPETWSLRLKEAGHWGALTVTCTAGGCCAADILAALAAPPVEPRIAELEAQLAVALQAADDYRHISERALALASEQITLAPMAVAA